MRRGGSAVRQKIFLVVDQIYQKTRRHLSLAKVNAPANSEIILAVVCGFPDGLPSSFVTGYADRVIRGTVSEIARVVRAHTERRRDGSTRILALNQSSLLPTEAVRKHLGMKVRSWIIDSCDKRRMRARLHRHRRLRVEFRKAVPGVSGSAGGALAGTKFIVKPAFGMSSKNVTKCDGWKNAVELAESTATEDPWVPDDVMTSLGYRVNESNARLIEPYIDGVEFSIDGFIRGSKLSCIVQHKLCVINRGFFGDGPTVSPPIACEQLPPGWHVLRTKERNIIAFLRNVLVALNYKKGVFHVECRESFSDRSLKVIEINPRAPGGSLWRSAMQRSGINLEETAARFQIGLRERSPVHERASHVLHYPFYADHPGHVVDWGDLQDLGYLGAIVDRAVDLQHEFKKSDMAEEPYLAFVTASAESDEALLQRCIAISELRSATIVQR
jgi:biotin carboxylase